MSEPPPEDPTPALLHAARAGDMASLDHLVRKHQDTLLQRIRGMMGERARGLLESSDILQDTLGDVVRGIHAFGPGDERRFLRWATMIAINNLRDVLRQRRLTLLDTVSGGLDTNTPSREASRKDLDGLVRRAIASMSEDLGQVLELRDVQRLTFDDIATRMNRSANAVQLLHTRAMTKLGQILRTTLDEA